PTTSAEFVNESPDRAGWPRRPPRKARRRVIAVGYGEEEQRRAAGCIGRPATGGDSFTDSGGRRPRGTLDERAARPERGGTGTRTRRRSSLRGRGGCSGFSGGTR